MSGIKEQNLPASSLVPAFFRVIIDGISKIMPFSALLISESQVDGLEASLASLESKYLSVSKSASDQIDGVITIPLSGTDIEGCSDLSYNLYENGEFGISGSIKPIYTAGKITSVLLKFDADCGTITGTIKKIY